MSKGISKLRAAIQNLDIKTPYGSPKEEVPPIEVPQNEAPKFDVPQGYFMLAHSIFMNPVVRELTGDAFRVFIWMSTQAYRFKNSDGTLRASIGYINAGTGVSQASVSRILDLLVKRKLVERVEVHSHKGNLWRVSAIAVGSPRIEATRSEGPQQKGRAHSNEANTSISLREYQPQIEGEVSNLNPSKNLNSLSLECGSVRKYLAELKPAVKRESEYKAFRDLCSEFSSEDLEAAFNQLQSEDPNGTTFHSPLAYLSKSICQVLARVKARNAEVSQKQSRDEQFRRREQTDRLKQAEEDALFDEMEARFCQAFPDASLQEEAYEKYAQGAPFLGEKLKKSFAIQAWWRTLGQNHST